MAELRPAWKQRVEAALPPVVATDLPAGAASVVGHAFDYRARYYFQVADPNGFVASHGASRLEISRPPALAAQLGGSRVTGRRSRPRWQAFAAALGAVTERISPVGRRLDNDDEVELNRFCYVLALFEQCFRSSAALQHSPVAVMSEGASVADLLALVPDRAVEDLVRLSDLFADVAEPYAGRPVICNPTFAGSNLVGGADGDVVLDGCLLDFKTTGKAGLAKVDAWQLAGYALLDFDDAYELHSAGFYLARRRALITWPLDELLDTLAAGHLSLGRLREDFAGMLGGA